MLPGLEAANAILAALPLWAQAVVAATLWVGCLVFLGWFTVVGRPRQ